MTTMQNDIVSFLADYKSLLGDKAHMYELDGLQARSERAKEKLNEVNATIENYKYDCELREMGWLN